VPEDLAAGIDPNKQGGRMASQDPLSGLTGAGSELKHPLGVGSGCGDRLVLKALVARNRLAHP
jgi:hypothetical protein